MWTCRWVPGSGRVGRSIPVRGIRWRERSSRIARRAASSGSSVGLANATRASRRRAAWRAPLEHHDAPSSVLPIVNCERIRTARSLFRSPRSQHPASRGTTRFPKYHFRRPRRRRNRESPRRSPRRDRHRHHTYTLESYTRRNPTSAGGYADPSAESMTRRERVYLCSQCCNDCFEMLLDYFRTVFISIRLFGSVISSLPCSVLSKLAKRGIKRFEYFP